MSTAAVETASEKEESNHKKENENHLKQKKIANIAHKNKHKHEENRHHKFGRKRLQSFTGNNKFYPQHKRRKKDGIIPPTKFLLGGNICDPLNLNSMQDEEINRAMNAVTPKSSPLPIPKYKHDKIEIIVPPNTFDPLNLFSIKDEDEYQKKLLSPISKNKKKRKKRKRTSSSSGDKSNKLSEIKDTIPVEEAKTERVIESAVEQSKEDILLPVPSQKDEPNNEQSHEKPKEKDQNKDKKIKLQLKPLEEIKNKRLRKFDAKDKIVSPVIPQPGAWKSRAARPNQDKKKKPQQLPNFNSKNARFQYGNYNRYYGYRNPHHDLDIRLTMFSQRKELFYGKDVLDIGCNIGHITLSIARDFGARTVTGIDIDKKLIAIARKNVKHYVNCVQSPENPSDGAIDANYFPTSMLINYGPVDIPGFTKHRYKGFPYNVTFVQGNYVLEDDALLASEQAQFDTIVCLSLTKWIHLNFGDEGLKQSFKRMHSQLRPGGVLILEPQTWSSYTKKKNLTERIYKNYHSITLTPNKFTQYLLSPAVGFHKCEEISVPAHPSKGFQRPIYLYTKAENPSVRSSLGTPHTLTSQDRFPSSHLREFWDPRGTPTTSQRSAESLMQYEQLENVYAPSATPCYDMTPVHNAENIPVDPGKMCYVDVSIQHNVLDEEISKDEVLNHDESCSMPKNHCYDELSKDHESIMSTDDQDDSSKNLKLTPSNDDNNKLSRDAIPINHPDSNNKSSSKEEQSRPCIDKEGNT